MFSDNCFFLLHSGVSVFALSVPHYEDYNEMIVNCSYNGSNFQFKELRLWYTFDGNNTFLLDPPRPNQSECGPISVVHEDTPKLTWSIMVVLQNCSQVSLQIGTQRSSGSSYDLSKPANLTVLKSKELQLQVVCS